MSAPLSPFPSSLSFSSLSFCSVSSLCLSSSGTEASVPSAPQFPPPRPDRGDPVPARRSMGSATDPGCPMPHLPSLSPFLSSGFSRSHISLSLQVEQEHAVESRVPSCSSRAARRHLAGDLDPGRQTSPRRSSTMDAALCSSASVEWGLLHAVLLAETRLRPMPRPRASQTRHRPLVSPLVPKAFGV